MMRRACEVFREPRYTRSELDRIFEDLQAGPVYLARGPRRTHDLTPFLLAYARGKDWQTGLPVSRSYFYRALRSLRDDEGLRGRVADYKAKGATLKQLARLFDKSIPTIQRMLRDPSER